MKARRPTYRNGTTAVYTSTFFERGRLVTAFDVWCEELDCQDRGCLDSFRSRGKARRLADGHRHRLIPVYDRRTRGYQRRRSA
jgi:hypothetical protein